MVSSASAPAPAAGPTNSLADVTGLGIGHATLTGDGWLTGVTVIAAPPGGAVGGVDVRGGGPGTRETDLLSPLNQVERVNAIMLSGGSAFGLGAAQGVMTRLYDLGRGFQVGDDPSHVVPIVPAAILFDLGRGGVFGNYPGPDAGAAAFDAAFRASGDGGTASGASVLTTASGATAGCIGAGTGALAGRLKGGIGGASEVLAGAGITVAALAAVNAAGSVADHRTGLLHGARFALPGELDWLRAPAPAELAAGAARLDTALGAGPQASDPSAPGAPRPLNTTIGVVATDASLTKAQCAKLAAVAQDGLARAIRPAHSMVDGDTIFALATGSGAPPAPLDLHAILTAAADCFTRAVVHAALSATTVTTPAGTWPSYLSLFPSADTRA